MWWIPAPQCEPLNFAKIYLRLKTGSIMELKFLNYQIHVKWIIVMYLSYVSRYSIYNWLNKFPNNLLPILVMFSSRVLSRSWWAFSAAFFSASIRPTNLSLFWNFKMNLRLHGLNIPLWWKFVVLNLPYVSLETLLYCAFRSLYLYLLFAQLP